MKTDTKVKRLGIAVCASALCIALVGCASPAGTSGTDAQKANRSYMSQVNEAMVELDENLDQFVSAVSRNDIVNMRTQASNAYQVLDELAAIEAPDELKTVRDSYVEGCDKLRRALDEYIALYTEISKADYVDKSAYDARIAQIQALYDEGVAALQKGDGIAAGSSQASSSSAESASSGSAISAPASADSSASAAGVGVDSNSAESASATAATGAGSIAGENTSADSVSDESASAASASSAASGSSAAADSAESASATADGVTSVVKDASSSNSESSAGSESSASASA